MKKKLTTVLAAMLALVMTFALVACGGKPSLADWYADNESEFTAITDSVNSQSEAMGCTMEIVVEDSNALVFRYTLIDAFDTSDPANVEALGQIYDSMFDSYASTFSEVRTQVMEETSTENVIIRLVALNPDGTELYSRDFTE